METETIDKLFVELSQVTTALTGREYRLLQLLRIALGALPLPRNRTQKQAKLCQAIQNELAAAGAAE
jgi:hypothetical protein